ncbi:hypothetical protein PTTG_29249 [Puccinia triticina 1-1 BBBD Race 1]|uniref:Uncharacterized protein n=1 Tax=Puccinia triticina (isolate 1-1 / race 1 (BBBD)) TaxID=630390 RepID=A0A180G5B8_PUCT1|nr:hypothetical protein PTTG_29249 [Puccinia triticina 1-1 BBBD Race 1]
MVHIQALNMAYGIKLWHLAVILLLISLYSISPVKSEIAPEPNTSQGISNPETLALRRRSPSPRGKKGGCGKNKVRKGGKCVACPGNTKKQGNKCVPK